MRRCCWRTTRARGIVIAPPIPIEDIVEKHLKLGIEFDDTPKLFGVSRSGLDPDILAAIFFDDHRRRRFHPARRSGEDFADTIGEFKRYRQATRIESPQFIVECRSARGAAYRDLSMLVLPRGHVDKIRRSLDVSNFAQPSPWNGRSSVTSSVTVQLTAR